MKPNFLQKLKSRVKRAPVHSVASEVKDTFRLHNSQKRPDFLQAGGVFFFLILCIFSLPQPAWALQTHGPPEGLYVHQMAHSFLMAALVYLGWDINRSSFTRRGWTLLKLFCVLFFLWNAVAITGHAMTTRMGKDDFYTESGYWLSRMLGPFDTFKTVYYVTKLDHLVSIPAMIFLVLGLRSFYLDSGKEDEE